LAVARNVALAIAMGELAVSILVVPPSVAILPVRIFGLLHAGVEDQIAGICLALIGLFAGIAAVAEWLVGRWGRMENAE